MATPAPITGLGDVLARLFGALGAKPCAPCDERRRKLNAWFPLGEGKRP